MDLACGGVDVRGQGGDIGGDQFLEFAVVEYISAYGCYGFECAQHLLGGRVVAVAAFLRLGVELQLPEQYIADLLGGVDIYKPLPVPPLKGRELLAFGSEHVTEFGNDLLLEVNEFGGELLFGLLEYVHIKPHAGPLHIAQHLHQRQFDLVVQVPQCRIGFEFVPLRRLVGVVRLLGVKQVCTEAGGDIRLFGFAVGGFESLRFAVRGLFEFGKQVELGSYRFARCG